VSLAGLVRASNSCRARLLSCRRMLGRQPASSLATRMGTP
jgi:hypothetical protein